MPPANPQSDSRRSRSAMRSCLEHCYRSRPLSLLTDLCRPSLCRSPCVDRRSSESCCLEFSSTTPQGRLCVSLSDPFVLRSPHGARANEGLQLLPARIGEHV